MEKKIGEKMEKRMEMPLDNNNNNEKLVSRLNIYIYYNT